MKFLLLTIAILTFLPVYSQTKRALLIGIGEYDSNTGWRKINGDRDMGLVIPMLEKNGFSKSNMIILKNSSATYNSIVATFESLISVAETHDIIYIHFSGHGQRITDLDGDEVNSDYDESWIPYDAPIDHRNGYNGEKHLVDDMINTFLLRLRSKIGGSGKITVVADACHSGDDTRSMQDMQENDNITRGSSNYFIIDGDYATVEKTSKRNIYWVSIAACKSYQKNVEYYDNESGLYYGRLTWILCHINNLSNIPIESLYNSVCIRMDALNISHIQEPEFQYPDSSYRTLSIF